MPSPTVTTIVQMLESLPLEAQEQVALHLREYIDDLQDELLWRAAFQQTQPKLIAIAQQAKQQIAEGQATTMNYDEL